MAGIDEKYKMLSFPDLGDERGKLVVAEGELDLLGVHQVGLDDAVAAAVDIDIPIGLADQVAAFEAEDQRAVLEEGLLDGSGDVAGIVIEIDVLRASLGC